MWAPAPEWPKGENISWREGISGLADGESLKRQFDALLERITKDSSLVEDTRGLAQEKIEALAVGLAQVQESPRMLRRALLDAKSWLSTTASWVGTELSNILKSDAAQKRIGTITEATTETAIDPIGRCYHA